MLFNIRWIEAWGWQPHERCPAHRAAALSVTHVKGVKTDLCVDDTVEGPGEQASPFRGGVMEGRIHRPPYKEPDRSCTGPQ